MLMENMYFWREILDCYCFKRLNIDGVKFIKYIVGEIVNNSLLMNMEFKNKQVPIKG